MWTYSSYLIPGRSTSILFSVEILHKINSIVFNWYTHLLPTLLPSACWWIRNSWKARNRGLLFFSLPIMSLFSALVVGYHSGYPLLYSWGFPGGSNGKEYACNMGNTGSNPGLERSPREGNGYPFQYSCLGNSTDRGAWQACPWGLKESNTTVRLTQTPEEYH